MEITKEFCQGLWDGFSESEKDRLRVVFERFEGKEQVAESRVEVDSEAPLCLTCHKSKSAHTPIERYCYPGTIRFKYRSKKE